MHFIMCCIVCCAIAYYTLFGFRILLLHLAAFRCIIFKSINLCGSHFNSLFMTYSPSLATNQIQQQYHDHTTHQSTMHHPFLRYTISSYLLLFNSRALCSCGAFSRVYHPLLHCTALRCSVVSCTALHYTALSYSALHLSSLHFTALHCTALQCIALHFTTLHHATLHHT